MCLCGLCEYACVRTCVSSLFLSPVRVCVRVCLCVYVVACDVVKLTLQVPTVELVEVHAINSLAPFILCSKLKALMLRSPSVRALLSCYLTNLCVITA